MNKRNWSLYKETKQGKEVISMFDMNDENWQENIPKMFDMAQSKGNFIEHPFIFPLLQLFAVNIETKGLIVDENNLSRESFEKFVQCLELHHIGEVRNGISLNEELFIRQGDFRKLNSLMHILSTYLYTSINSFYKPLIYQSRFDIIQHNCDVLGIELPDIPHTNDYSTYMMYYYDMCVAFDKFQKENNLTDEEFCACLYDYAETLGEEEKVDTELPRPTNIWFVGASKTDMQRYKDGALNEDVQIWQCNERTRRGDIIVLYALSPYSCIHSIWRAKSGGFFNPFDFYQNRTTICNCHEIPTVSFKELKEHPYFMNLPIVRKNLQGINGVELTATDYQELLKLLQLKGSNISHLPQLTKITDWVKPEITKGNPEQQVEEKLLIPVLEKLGYVPADWSRQLEQKAGRGLKAIPDFVFLPHGELHMHNAPLVIEAKYDMSSSKEYDKAFRQGLSYARMLRSDVMGICDQSRLVLYRITNLGSADKTKPIYEAQWAVINTDVEIFNRLQKIIGKTVITNL